jgi:hypothetical protein
MSQENVASDKPRYTEAAVIRTYERYPWEVSG